MKKIVFIAFTAISFFTNAQKTLLKTHELKAMISSKNLSSTRDTSTADKDKSGIDYKLKGFNLGLGIGGNFTINQNLVSPTISPFDNKLVFDKNSGSNLTLTTLFMVPLRGTKTIEENAKNGKSLGGKVYQYGASNKENTTYVVPYGPYIVVNVNFNDFTKAASVKPFNQIINGGIGLGWRFNDLALAALTFDATAYKQPKDFLLQKEGQVLQNSDGTTIASIDTSDTNYFKDITAWSVSLKVVYILSSSD